MMTVVRRWFAGRRARLGLVLVTAGLVALGAVAWFRLGAWPVHAVLVPGDPLGSQPQGFTPDGRAFQASGADGLTTWDVDTGRRTGVAPPPVPWRRSYNGDRSSFVAVYRTQPAPSELRRVDAANGAVLARVALPSMPLFPPTWAPGDRSVRCVLAATGGGLEVATWDLAAGHVEVRPLAIPVVLGGARALAPDGRTLALAAEGGEFVRLWDVQEDRPVGDQRRGLAVLGGTSALAFGPDGRTLAVGRVDGVVEVRAVPDLRPIRTIPAHAGGFIPAELAVSPDGRTLASTGFRHRSAAWIAVGRQFRWAVPAWGERTSFETVVLDLATGRPLASAGREASPAYSPDGRWIVTHTPNSSYRVHDAPRPPAP